MSGSAAGEKAFRRGPRSQIALMERSLRRHNLLEDDQLIEWRQGWVQRWRVDGLEQPVPRPYGLQRVRPLRGMSSFSYSSRSLFFWAGNSIPAADLSRVHRLEAIGRGSLCVVYSPVPAAIVSVQWRTGEVRDDDEELAAQVSRVLAQRERRLSGLPQAGRSELLRERAYLDAFGVVDAEFARASAAMGTEPAAPGDRIEGAATVVGRFLQALIGGDVAERQRFQAQLNGGRPGWSYDEAAVVQATCELACQQHWGIEYHGGDISNAASVIHDATQRTASPHSQEDVEAVIWSALSESGTGIATLAPPALFEIQGAVTAYIARMLQWPPQLTGALLARAEQVSFDRGWNPPLAT